MALAAVAGDVREKPLDAFAGESAEETPADEPAPRDVTPTADWHPEGATCEACGATVERRWRQGEAMVCPDCKDWTEG